MNTSPEKFTRIIGSGNIRQAEEEEDDAVGIGEREKYRQNLVGKIHNDHYTTHARPLIKIMDINIKLVSTKHVAGSGTY